MAAVLRSIFGFPLCCFPCLGKAKKNPVSQASAGIGDLCGSSGAEEKCPLFKIFDGSSSSASGQRKTPTGKKKTSIRDV